MLAAAKYFSIGNNNDWSNTSVDDYDSFVIFSIEPENKPQESIVDLEVIIFFNDKNRSLSMLDSYPIVKIYLFAVTQV